MPRAIILSEKPYKILLARCKKAQPQNGASEKGRAPERGFNWGAEIRPSLTPSGHLGALPRPAVLCGVGKYHQAPDFPGPCMTRCEGYF